MPFGLCGKQNVTEEIHVRIELLDNSVLQLALPRDANGLECLEMVTEKLGISEVSSAKPSCGKLAWFRCAFQSHQRSMTPRPCTFVFARRTFGLASVDFQTVSVRYQSHLGFI